MKAFALLAVLALAGCIGTDPGDDPSTVKVLMIGNGFSIGCLRHLPQIAEEGGVSLDLNSLYIGDASLSNHLANAADRLARPYRYDRIVRGRRLVERSRRNIRAALCERKWDVVTIQQASPESWRPETYRRFGNGLVALIRELAPTADIYVQETWSYTPWDARLAKWGLSPAEMYRRLHAACESFAEENGLETIAFGTAVESWRRRLPVRYTERSFGGDVVGGGGQAAGDRFVRNARNEWVPNGDVCHLNAKGEYFQALVWAEAILDIDVSEIEYKPDFVTDGEAELMKEIAQGE